MTRGPFVLSGDDPDRESESLETLRAELRNCEEKWELAQRLLGKRDRRGKRERGTDQLWGPSAMMGYVLFAIGCVIAGVGIFQAPPDPMFAFGGVLVSGVAGKLIPFQAALALVPWAKDPPRIPEETED